MTMTCKDCKSRHACTEPNKSYEYDKDGDLYKQLIEIIVNSKSKIKTSNFQGKNSLQAYLNGKAQREQEIIDIINKAFCEDDE